MSLNLLKGGKCISSPSIREGLESLHIKILVIALPTGLKISNSFVKPRESQNLLPMDGVLVLGQRYV